MTKPQGSARASGTKRILIGIGLALLVLLLWWILRPKPDVSRDKKTRVASEQASPPKSSQDPRLLAPMPGPGFVPPALRGPPPEKPIIDKVILEKTEVCEGEENLVTVLAHTPGNRDDAYLHYTIGSSTGRAVALRSYKRDVDDHEPGGRTITVFGRNNVATTVKVPYFKIKDCKVDRILAVMSRKVTNTEDEFEFHAKIVNKAAKDEFKAVRYRWTFGDGKTATTKVPVVTHSFAARNMDTMYSQLLVRCEAFDKKGRKAEGRTSLQLMNVAFEEFHYKGLVALFFSYDPRYPELNEQGVVEQSVTVWHHWPAPVRITRCLKNTHYTAQNRRVASTSSSTSEVVDPFKVLGTTVIPIEGIETLASLDVDAAPDLFSVEYILFGETPEGYKVHGRFTIMRPPKRPTKKDHDPVVSPELKAKILAARKILGKEFVTDEDLSRLEKLGHFKNLKVNYNDRAYPHPLPPPPMK